MQIRQRVSLLIVLILTIPSLWANSRVDSPFLQEIDRQTQQADSLFLHGNFTKAIKAYELVLKKSEKLAKTGPHYKIKALKGIIRCYVENNQCHDANQTYLQFSRLADSSPQTERELKLIGDCYLKTDSIRLSNHYYQKVLDLPNLKEQKDLVQYLAIRLTLAENYLKLGERDSAVYILEAAANVFPNGLPPYKVSKTDSKASETLREIYITLAKLYKETQRPDLGFDYLIKTISLDSQRFEIFTSHPSVTLRKFAISDQDIGYLEKDVLQLERFTKFMIAIIILTSIVFVLIIYIFYQKRIHSNKINFALIEGKSRERNRISEDLHDRIGYKLAEIKALLRPVNLGTLDIAKIEKKINDTHKELRLIAHSKKPLALRFGLVAALESMQYEINRIGHTHVTLFVSTYEGILDNTKEEQVFSIINELISNILLHSRASEAEIHLDAVKSYLQVLVEDNGIGFKPEETALASVKSRIYHLKGKLEAIESNSKIGTSVRFRIPI